MQVGLPSEDPGGTLVQQFSIGPLGERWLPAAFRPVAIDLPDTLVVKSSDTLVADASDVSGLDYVVASKLPPLAGTQFTPAQIAATVGAAAPRRGAVRRTAEDRRDRRDRTDRPAGRRRSRRNHAVRAGRSPPRLLPQVPRSVYDTSVGSLDNGSAILEFLRTKRGFCVQFASAYAVMARSLGIPARVAVGFTPGAFVDGRYHVTSHDAHAWPEIYLTGIGWTHLFDPTPAQSGAASGGSQLPNDTAADVAATTTPPVTTAPTVTSPPAAGGSSGTPQSPGTTPVTPTLTPATAPSSGDALGPWLVVIVVLVGLLLLSGAYVGAVLVAKRRRRDRRRHAADPALVVAGAWEEALDRLREADLAADPALTANEVARSVPVDLAPPTAHPLRDLARAYSAARYSDGATGPDDARDAWTSLGELEVALDDGVSWTRRWRRRLDPSTFTHR